MLAAIQAYAAQKAHNCRGVVPDDDMDTEPTSGGLSKLTKEDFDVVGLLGKGRFGTVLLVNKVDTGRTYAMKVVHKETLIDSGRLKDMFSERSVLKRAKHPYIVKLDYTFQTEHQLFFVMEHLQGGDLGSMLNQCPGKLLPEDSARFYGAQVLTALQFLHANGVIYRDLKLENILLDAAGNACLSDFGLSKDFGLVNADSRADSFVGSPYYVAPDVLRQVKYCNKVDWWSFGILLYRMLAGFFPFQGWNMRQVFDAILYRRHDYSRCPWVSGKAQDLIDRLLEKEEFDRMGGDGVEDHAFFKTTDWEAIHKKTAPTPFCPGRTPVPVIPVNPADVAASPLTVLAADKQDLFCGFTYTASLDPKLVGSVPLRAMSHSPGGSTSPNSPLSPLSPASPFSAPPHYYPLSLEP